MSTSPERRPGLDGIRAVAVAAVLIAHFTSTRSWFNPWVRWGRSGVVLFFVLSGFLITGMLLGYRDDIFVRGASRSACLRVFYVRRTLRIFPIYYLTVLAVALAGYPPIRDHLFWVVSYSENISVAFFGGKYHDASHLWSLCVEEQFYLIWPAVILFTSRRLLRPVILLTVAAGVVYRMVSPFVGCSWMATNHLLPGCLDSLGLGALLALYRHDPISYSGQRANLARAGLLLGLPGLILLRVVLVGGGGIGKAAPLLGAWVDLAASLIFVALIDTAGHDAGSVLTRGLSWAPLRYIGTISYGIYLYHSLLVPALVPVWRRLGVAEPPAGGARLVLYSALAIAVAAASWHLVEAPFNRLKSRFTPLRAAPRAVPVAAA